MIKKVPHVRVVAIVFMDAAWPDCVKNGIIPSEVITAKAVGAFLVTFGWVIQQLGGLEEDEGCGAFSGSLSSRISYSNKIMEDALVYVVEDIMLS